MNDTSSVSTPCAQQPATEHNLWDPQREGEKARQAEPRWRKARLICLTECPALDECRAHLYAMQARGLPTLGVWAGRIRPDMDEEDM